MLAWVSAAFLFIAIIIGLWLWNATRVQNDVAYGAPADDGALEVPHTPFIIAQNRQATDVPSIAEGLPDATRFSALLGSTGVGSLLKGKGPYTIFVPTDRALSQLPAGFLANMSAAQLKRFVEYAVVTGRAVDVNAVNSGSITALSGDALNFSVNQGDQSARVNSSVVLEGYATKNGLVYLINAALLPPVTPVH
jgi:uncharacterized surface protein with fasciclin (FAS1) repeats